MIPTSVMPENSRATSAESSSSANAARQNIFSDALLSQPSLGHRRGAAEWLISLSVHGATLAAVLIVPFFCAHTIDPQQLQLTYLAAPMMQTATPPPLPHAAMAPPQVSQRQILNSANLTMPGAIPKTPLAARTSAEPLPEIAGVPGAVAGGVLGGQSVGTLGRILGCALNDGPAHSSNSSSGVRICRAQRTAARGRRSETAAASLAVGARISAHGTGIESSGRGRNRCGD